MKSIGLATLALALLFNTRTASAQTNGDYQTRVQGAWNMLGRWQVYYNGWQYINSTSAGPYYNVIPSSSSGVITIKSGHAIVVSAPISINQVVVESGASLTVDVNIVLTAVDDFTTAPIVIKAGGFLTNNGTLDLQSHLTSTPCEIDGTLKSNSVITISNPNLLKFNSGSLYDHYNRSGGRIPSAIWNSNSTCSITNLTTTNPAAPTNLSQSFGHFVWNTPAMGATTTFSLAGGLQEIKGNLIFISTGTTPREVRLKNGGPGYQLKVGGNFIIQNGTVTLTQTQTSATTLSIGGNLELSGGSLVLGSANNADIVLLIQGELKKTGGVLTRGAGSGTCTILPYSPAIN